MPKTKKSDPRTKEQPFKLTVDYFSTAVSAWLIPGAGHFLLGYRVRGTVIGASILALFWVGQALAMPVEAANKAPMAVSRKVSPVFFGCQMGNGLSTLVSNQLWGESRYGNDLKPLDRKLPRHINLAILLTSVSGLLNLLVVLHVLDPKTWRDARQDVPKSAHPPEGPT